MCEKVTCTFQIGFEKCLTSIFQICFGKCLTNKMASDKLKTNVLHRFGFKCRKNVHFQIGFEKRLTNESHTFPIGFENCFTPFFKYDLENALQTKWHLKNRKQMLYIVLVLSVWKKRALFKLDLKNALQIKHILSKFDLRNELQVQISKVSILFMRLGAAFSNASFHIFGLRTCSCKSIWRVYLVGRFLMC